MSKLKTFSGVKQYTSLGFIGSGAHGQVYKVFDKLKGVTFALKQIKLLSN